MRAILFDFGGTLDFPRHWLDRFVVHYQGAGLTVERAALDRSFTVATQQAYACSANLRNYSLRQLVGLLVELQFGSLGCATEPHSGPLVDGPSRQSIGELKVRIRDSFVAESVVGFASTRPLLAELARNFKIAVVSNFYGNLDRVIADAGFKPAVSITADSGLLGFYKPDPRIFAASLSKLGLKPHDAIMVGDSIKKDCAPAREMGMRTVWLRHVEANGRDPASALVDFTIDSLEELKELGWLAG
jgi:phosphoglycolate phosphatase-like HAD superfamily hydrolase